MVIMVFCFKYTSAKVNFINLDFISILCHEILILISKLRDLIAIIFEPNS